MVKVQAKFESDIKRSMVTVRRIATILEGRGHKVKIISEGPITTTEADRFKNRDNGDLEVRLYGDGDPVRMEVKHRKLNFRSRNDFPFETVIVDEVYKIDNAESKLPLYGYLTINAAATTALFIPAWTKDKWVKGMRFDPDQRRECEFYFCPRGQTLTFPLEVPANQGKAI